MLEVVVSSGGAPTSTGTSMLYIHIKVACQALSTEYQKHIQSGLGLLLVLGLGFAFALQNFKSGFISLLIYS